LMNGSPFEGLISWGETGQEDSVENFGLLAKLIRSFSRS